MPTMPGIVAKPEIPDSDPSSDGDTIEVRHIPAKVQTPAIKKPSKPASKAKPARRDSKTPVSRPSSRRASKRHQKEPVQPIESDSDDEVEEYVYTEHDFAADHEFDIPSTDGEHADDAKSVISLSSEASDDAPASLSQRPWKEFDRAARIDWETMYASATNHAVNGDWEMTEDYQREKDREMLEYLEDFPLNTWLIRREDAQAAWYQLHERQRWRSLGTRIYGRSHPIEAPQDRMAAHRFDPHFVHAESRFMPHIGGFRAYPATAVPDQAAFAQQNGHQHSGFTPFNQPFVPTPIDGGQHHILHPLSHYPAHTASPSQETPQSEPQPRRKKPKPAKGKEPVVLATSPPPRAPTPPYSPRLRPADPPKASSKNTKKQARRMAETEEYPWCRDLDFKEARANASWDDSIYDPDTLIEMENTRIWNAPIIEDLDNQLVEQQRLARLARKEASGRPPPGTPSRAAPAGKRNGPRKRESGAGGDSYHTGNFTYATAADERKATILKQESPDQLIEAVEAGLLALDKCAKIKILWNPGKKVSTNDLRQVVFTVRDTILTRRQLERTPILTRRAAECVIDFCPDKLWRSMLLRITSEAGLGNKDVRDRFCNNGCYCDKATITKRISAALGQKQLQPNSKGYTQDEWSWYEENVRDFGKYIDFFGKRTSHRNMPKIIAATGKRKVEAAALEEE